MNRPPERINRIMSLINEVWKERSDLRFFQLISLLENEYSKQHEGFGREVVTQKDTGGMDMPYHVIDLFYLEDDKLEKFLVRLLEQRL